MNDDSYVQMSSYYDEISSTYDEIFDDPVSRAEDFIIAKSLNRLVRDGDSILDCGCGTGLGKELINSADVFYHGVDISTNMIQLARSKHPDSRFLVGDMANLSHYEESTFDVLISINGSYSHVSNPALVADEIFRVLKPGGQFMVMVYSRFSLSRLIKHWRQGVFKHEAPYSVRNTDNEMFVPARFYCYKRLGGMFDSFKDLEFDCLNIIPELLKGRLDYRRCVELMEAERRAPLWVKKFAHALVVTGRK